MKWGTQKEGLGSDSDMCLLSQVFTGENNREFTE